ncbi:MAG: beta-galactosidase [Cyclobacteriaceae bacterium]|nr:beta-galactosidase [Cyclobacteriaceae bacterium]
MHNKKIFIWLILICWVLTRNFSIAQDNRNEMNVMPENGSMFIGVDYYPEHWPEERWKTDLQMMKEAGFNVVRLSEFAWVLFEPSEGNYEFAWLDDFLKLLPQYDIKVILGTPTAVMPAWVARKYPETLATMENGQQIVWGSRKNNCFSSGTYRLLSERITRAMAEHYKDHPSVIGWQTDNEFAGPVCYCNTCRNTFQDWVRERYITLDSLNSAWGTHFWGHKIQTWGEIQIPKCNGEGRWGASGNPGACLDWMRFNSWLNVRFQHDQVQIIRDVCPQSHFITHNLMSFHPEVSYFDLGKDLDFVSWDNYPVWNKPDLSYEPAMAADLMRGIKQKNFLIMEQTAGPSGWGNFFRNPRPGEIRKICYQQLAHGADGQIWFRWRTCTAGREQYWHGLLGHDGRALRRYKEASQVATEYRNLEKYLTGTTVKADVGILYDYTSIWSLTGQPGFVENIYVQALRRYYQAFYRAGINVDLINPEADFSRYKLLVASDQIVLPDQLAGKLNDYVRQGGVLLADCRTGVKNETNLAWERTLPGKLSASLGIEIQEYEAVTPDFNYKVYSNRLFEDTVTAIHYIDWAIPVSAESMAAFDQWHLKNFSPVTRNKYGNGTGWYVGMIAAEETFYDSLIENLLKDAGIETYINLPVGIEASLREGNGKRLLFLINHTEEEQTVILPEIKKELISDKKTGKSIVLGVFGVAVFEL